MATAHLNGSYGHNGEAVAASPAVPSRRGVPSPSRTRLLGDLLVQERLVTEAQLAAALHAQETSPDGTPIGQLLVEQGALSPADLEAVLKRYHKKYRLGDILVETNAISETQLQLAVDHHRRTGLRLGDALLQLAFVNEDTLKHALCTQLDVAFVDLEVMTGCHIQLVMSTDAAFQRAFTRVYGESPEVGLARQHDRLAQAHAALSREHGNATRALDELRQVHEEFLRDQADLLRVTGEQASQQGLLERRLAELQAAHASLREEHEARGRAHAELGRTQSETLETLAAIRGEHGRLLVEHGALGAKLTEERERSAELARRLADLEAAHIVGRRELEERLTALTALDAAYAETTHALAGLRVEHEALRQEYERISCELRERCFVAEGRQQLAVQQLESLLGRLRG
jgi:hypothetical protein